MIGSIFKGNTTSNHNKERGSYEEVPSLNKRSSSRFKNDSQRRKEDMEASSMMRFQENLDKKIGKLSRKNQDFQRQRNPSHLNGKAVLYSTWITFLIYCVI